MLALLLAQLVLVTFVLVFLIRPVFNYFRDQKGFRKYPSASPFAPLSSLWMIILHWRGLRTKTVFEAHKKLGPVVRLGPNHLSFTALEAIKDIYGHGTPAFKSEFYNSFAGSHTNLIDTLDKEDHAKKRKSYTAAFAQKQVEEKEGAVREDILGLVEQWDKFCTSKPTPAQIKAGFKKEDGLIDARRWLNLLMLDLAVDFAFGIKVHFVRNGDDLTECESLEGHKYLARPEGSFNPNLLCISTMGFAPPSLLWLNRKLFSWHRGIRSDGQINTDFVIRLIRQRFRMEAEQVQSGEKASDFFQGLNYTKDGIPIGLELGTLIQECGLLVAAGSETTSVALQNILHYVTKNPRVKEKLYEELERAFPEEEVIPSYDEIKFLPYLRAVIDETLRHRPSLSIALPRASPAEGMRIAGHWVPGSTMVSVPTWTVHHLPEYFDRPDEFIPERWLGESGIELQKAFMPFSHGARACVGRNMAYMELYLIVATVFRRYDMALMNEGWMPEVVETMVIKAKEMPIKIWRRSPKVKEEKA